MRPQSELDDFGRLWWARVQAENDLIAAIDSMREKGYRLASLADAAGINAVSVSEWRKRRTVRELPDWVRAGSPTT